MKKLIIEIDGMNCGGCVKKIKAHFEPLSNIQNIEVYLDDKKVEITGDDDLSNMKVRDDLIELGFSVNSIKKI